MTLDTAFDRSRAPRDLRVTPERAAAIRAESRSWVSCDLTRRQLADYELLSTGACAPLTGYLSRADYESVCERMRLAGGAFWPMPLTLDVTDALAERVRPGDMIALRDPEGVLLAAVAVEDVWRPDAAAEADAIFGTGSPERPGVAAFLNGTHPWRVGGRVETIELPPHYAFQNLRRDPAQLRADFAARGWTRVLVVQPIDPMHRAERERALRSARDCDAGLLIHPAVGMPLADDPDFYMRVRCYEKLLATCPRDVADLNLLPLATRLAGTREALWRAVVQKNYGCTHVLVDPEAAEAVAQYAPEIGVEVVPRSGVVFVLETGDYVSEDQVPPGRTRLSLPASELRSRLADGREIPEWFSYPAIVAELRRTHPPRSRQGFTVFFTGLSGSGKSTLANALLVRLMERHRRPVTLLDGDTVRKHLSSELGFSKEHRDIHIRRIGYVASEITKAGAIAICCPIAPYARVREEVRGMIEPYGGFVLIHVATPIEVCEQRDRKGLYAKARAGLVPHFTGVSDPYEAPADAEISIDTTDLTPGRAVELIFAHLIRQGFLLAVVEDDARKAGWRP